MAVIATWKNSEFALPLCNPIAFHPVEKPAIQELDPLECVCVKPVPVGIGDNGVACEVYPWTVSGYDFICPDCGIDGTAPHWQVFIPQPGTAPPVIILLHWDKVVDSCRFVSEDDEWVLDIHAKTLTYIDIYIWELADVDGVEQEWECLTGNLVFNPEPPNTPEEYDRRFICLSPIEMAPGCEFCAVVGGIPARYRLTISGVSGDCAACDQVNGVYDLDFLGFFEGDEGPDFCFYNQIEEHNLTGFTGCCGGGSGVVANVSVTFGFNYLGDLKWRYSSEVTINASTGSLVDCNDSAGFEIIDQTDCMSVADLAHFLEIESLFGCDFSGAIILVEPGP